MRLGSAKERLVVSIIGGSFSWRRKTEEDKDNKKNKTDSENKQISDAKLNDSQGTINESLSGS